MRLKGFSRSLELTPNGGPSKGPALEKAELGQPVAANRDACREGLSGRFAALGDEFGVAVARMSARENFQEDPKWAPEERRRVKRFRFVVCSLGLVGLSLAVSARMILNVAIVDMAAECQPAAEGDPEAGWSVGARNLLLSSFHLGYIPSMLLSGSLADTHGAYYPLALAVLSSGILGLATPLVARSSFLLLVALRVLLGVLQGGMIPAAYDLFNRWLTLAETSIFVPLVKVSLAAGAFAGSLLPGLTSALGYRWPSMFYAASLICLVWGWCWLALASSRPQGNAMVGPSELQRIQREKPAQQPDGKAAAAAGKSPQQAPTPWLQIVCCTSVLALTLAKFTYNLGAEFLMLQQASYLRLVHQAPTPTISLIASASYLTQMAFVGLIGLAARWCVDNRLLGLSRTKWRKIFQGTSNFGMAALYLAWPLIGDSFTMVAATMVLINFMWMFGAGGESMLPYDLSSRYPATIMGFCHSISVLSSLAIGLLCGLVLAGDAISQPESWALLFKMEGAALLVGGLVFCLFVKAKPFLPGERDPSQGRGPSEVVTAKI